MHRARVVSPAVLPVTIDELRRDLRLGSSAAETPDDARALAAAARATERLETYLGRALITQTWEITAAAFPVAPWRLPVPPFRSLDLVEIVTPSGATVPLDLATDVVARVAGLYGYVLPVGATWPDLATGRPDAVRLRWTCGYGDTPAMVPEPLRGAASYLTLYWHDSETPGDLPASVLRLVDDYREYSA